MGKRHAKCKLCTEIVRNLDEHICSQKHIEKIVLPINDKECIRELDNTKSHCILCNELVENADFHAIYNKRHEALLKNAILLSEEGNTSQIKPNITALESTNEEQEAKDRACKTADSNIDNAQSALEKNKGVVLLDVLDFTSTTDRTKSKKFFCSDCHVILHKRDIRAHIFKHKKLQSRNTLA